MAGLRPILVWFDMRRRLIVVLLVGWGLVIASGTGAAAEDARWLGTPRFERALAPLAILYVAVVVGLLVFAVATNVQRPTKTPERRSQWKVLFVLVLLVLLATVFPRRDADDVAPDEPEAPVEAAEPVAERDPVVGRNELLPLLAILVSAVGVLVWTKRRIERPENEVESLALGSELEPLIREVIGGLELGTDPRSSVIRAYSQLEEALGAHGGPRRATETPMEHIRRALAHLSIDTTPVLQLARLYEVARFSDHAISIEDQRRAIEGLNRVRDDLAATASATVMP